MTDEDLSSRVETRYGHSEGITAVGCFQDANGEKLVSCGADSELRIWKGFNVEDPDSHQLTDNGLTLLCSSNGVVYVGTEFNTVEALSLEDGKNLGVKTRFTAPVNHIDLSKDEKWLVAGSGDMKIQLVNLEDTSNPPVTIETHTAPVLSVALDPLKEFLVSSGCDGNVCIWSLTEEGNPVHLVKKFENVFPRSNDISISCTLCRISWEANGKILAVPEEDHVALYSRESWAKLKVLKPDKSAKIASVTKFSQCGNYLAAGGSDGTLVVWNISDSSVLVEETLFPDHITSITFTNNELDILAADNKGRILNLKNFKAAPSKATLTLASSTEKSNKPLVNPDQDEFDMDDNDDLASPPSSPTGNQNDVFDDGNDDLFMDDDDDNEISISKIKAATGFIDDEYVGVGKAKVILGEDLKEKEKKDDDDNSSVSSFGSRPASRSSRPVIVQAPPPKIPFTEPQKPFQPASSPVHIDHRFMIWNNTGIIRAYSHDDDEKQAIDIEFHDAAVHHAVHLRNQHDYTLATLTKEVAVFSNEKQSDAGSKLFCYCFTSWDSKKEWTTDLPIGEEIIGLAAGEGWIAVSTNLNRVRIFTIGGAQKQIIEVGGQIITTSGNEDLLFITFHNGIGLHGNQCIAHSIFRIKPSLKPFPLVSCEPLPLTPKSKISWVGFSDEGTPVCSDSKDVVRILSGRYWTTFSDLKEHLAGASDHFWVVGISELDQKIRAVKCKGMAHPPTLPRPVLMQLEAKIPFCEMEDEKSQLEDRFHRSLMLDALAKKMDKKNYEVDEYKTKAEKELKESLFSLFVLSCKGDWDARGAEYVSMMPSAHAVQIAVKYASKLRKKGLVDRLTAIGRRKLDEEELAVEGDDDDFETLKMGTVVYSNVRTLAADYSASQDLFSESMTSNRLNTSVSSLSTSFSGANRSIITVPDEENPFMKKNTDEIRKLLGGTETSSNRFRKDKPVDTGEGGKGLSKIDSWKKPAEKPSDLFAKTTSASTRVNKFAKKGNAADKDKNKDQGGNKDKKKQTTLLDMGRKGKESGADMSEENNDSASIENQGVSEQNDIISRNSESLLEDSTNLQHQDAPVEERPKPKQGFMLWFDENKEMLEKENPASETKDLVKVGMQLFKKLSLEEKKKYNNPASNLSEEKKRKRSDLDDDPGSSDVSKTGEGDKLEKRSKISSKLAMFVRKE